MDTLEKYLEDNRGKELKFNPIPHYFRNGNFITYFFKDNRAYEDCIDKYFTIYRDVKTNEMVGCKILLD